MKTIYTLSLVALALTATTFLACSNDNLTIENNPTKQDKIVTLTATLSPKGGTNTKALTDPGDGTITSTWAVDEELLVSYQKTNDDWEYVKVKVSSIDGSGNAIVTLNLDDPKNGSDINFNYPYSSAAVEKDYYYDQLGTLSDISQNYDLCRGDGILNVVGSVASLAGNVTMTRNAFIWKFTFTDGSSDITNQITSLVIDDGGGCPYTISPSGLSTIYVAMTSNGAPADISITAVTGTGIYAKTKTGVTLDNGKLYTSNSVALTAKAEVDLSSKAADYTANSGDVLTGTLDPNYKLIIPMDAVVMLKGATIAYGGYDAPAISCLDNATIVLADGSTNTVTVPGDQGGGPGDSGSPYPGILASPYGYKLTLKGNTGILNVVGGYIASGIGCLNVGGANGMGASYTAYDGQCGVIQIDGGVISSYSGNKVYLGDGAETGIGNVCGGSADLCEGIIINGGTITVQGGAAGIGSSGGANVGYITINGGTITTYGGGSGGCPGIGAGAYGNCGPITINGGTINSYGGVSSAGIGSGEHGTCGNILITGGTIKAIGDEPGIGSGASGSCGTITITGGDITAVSSEGWSDPLIAAHNGTGPGIGAGMGSTCGAISISGGTVDAKGGAAAAGIGSASGGSSSYTSLTIANGITKVTATKGIGGSENKPIGQGDSDATSPNPIFSGVTKDDVNSTESTWIYE